MPETRPIALSSILLPKGRLRAVREETVSALAQSMAVQGQLQPIVVRRDHDGKYWLVAGLHRFDAARKLKWDEIICNIFDDMDADQAELAEIDENLIRADLTPAEEAIHIGRRKAIYEKLHPETVHGAVGRRGKRSQHATSFEPADSFIDDAAKRTGKHRATIARKAARAKKVSVLPDIVGTVLDNGAEIDALAKLTVEKQQSLVQAAKRGERVSAVPRDHNLKDHQMDEQEVDRAVAGEKVSAAKLAHDSTARGGPKQSACDDPEVPNSDLKDGDECRLLGDTESAARTTASPEELIIRPKITKPLPPLAVPHFFVLPNKRRFEAVHQRVIVWNSSQVQTHIIVDRHQCGHVLPPDEKKEIDLPVDEIEAFRSLSAPNRGVYTFGPKAGLPLPPHPLRFIDIPRPPSKRVDDGDGGDSSSPKAK